MDLLSRGRRIHNVHPDIDVLDAGSSDTPHWSPHYVTTRTTNFGMWTGNWVVTHFQYLQWADPQ